ncbi:TetR family transcriptional regulator [Hahella sp. CCB-MM4]|uniref:TetR/AcrR family transcriptional regulator n=1 Tax=Hahella sp. (strain CCB-MM4) TaxID=1926491 RepID=UPI000B9BFA56|nr:TetR/AcrR family transcriptional regulator [Hahella sp. CCB-MM4]OZG71597.1 TetR family transcriptional regulator [Hahella sp. CCB-MM4]
MPYSKEHKLRTKDRILKSATDLFCRYGFEKVSIQQVMASAKMTHGAFYSHFDSKEALYRASIVDTIRRSKAVRLAKDPLSLKHMTELVSNYLNLRDLAQRNDPGPESILFNDIDSGNPEIKKVYEESYLRLVKLLEKRLKALRRLNRLPVMDGVSAISEKARLIVASLVGAVAVAKSISQEEERRRILSAAQKHILIMLGYQDSELETIHR